MVYSALPGLDVSTAEISISLKDTSSVDKSLYLTRILIPEKSGVSSTRTSVGAPPLISMLWIFLPLPAQAASDKTRARIKMIGNKILFFIFFSSFFIFCIYCKQIRWVSRNYSYSDVSIAQIMIFWEIVGFSSETINTGKMRVPDSVIVISPFSFTVA